MRIKTYTTVTTGLSYDIGMKDGSDIVLNNYVFKGMENGHYVFLDLASRVDLTEDSANVDSSAFMGADGTAFHIEYLPGADAVTTDWNGQRFPAEDVAHIDICPTSLDWLTILEAAHMFQYASSVERV